MIRLPVSEAYAFDYLAILMVKCEKRVNARKAWETLALDVARQVGALRFKLVRRSPEFKRLLSANRRVFNLVERAARNLCSAQDVEQANYERFLAKRELQERFWPNEPLDERKSARP